MVAAVKMASGGQSKRRKSYDLKFNLDAVDFDDLACIDRSRVPRKRRVPDYKPGVKVSCTMVVLIEAGGFYPRFYGNRKLRSIRKKTSYCIFLMLIYYVP